MDYTIWEMPEDKDDFFSNGESEYRFCSYDDECYMDNNESMSFFIEHLDFTDEEIISNDGTQIIVKIKDKEFQIDSSGFGDFNKHKFDVIILKDDLGGSEE